jgi:hypothetical protein
MLGSGRQKLQKGKLLPQGELPIEERLAKLDQVKLEAKKGRKARVEVDVILESDVMVEGGELRGRLEVRIRKSRRGESLWIGAGKVRVCGYEGECHRYFGLARQLTFLSRMFCRAFPYLLPTHLLPLSSSAAAVFSVRR